MKKLLPLETRYIQEILDGEISIKKLKEHTKEEKKNVTRISNRI